MVAKRAYLNKKGLSSTHNFRHWREYKKVKVVFFPIQRKKSLETSKGWSRKPPNHYVFGFMFILSCSKRQTEFLM